MTAERHPVELLDYHGDPVQIDVEIVPLIRLLWAHGFETFNSCQDFAGDGMVWVEFDGPSATDFMNLVARLDGALRAHMLHSVPHGVDSPDVIDAWIGEHGWTYSVLPWVGWGDEIQFLVSVHFPRHDLPAVVAALEAAPREEAT